MPQQEGSSRMKAVVGGLLAVGIILTGGLAMAAKGPKGGDYGRGYGRAYGHRLHCPSYNGMYHSKGRATCHTAPRRGGVTGAEVPRPDEARRDQGDANGSDGGRPSNTASATGTSNATAKNDRPNNARGNPSAPARAQANQPQAEGRAEQGPPATEVRNDRVDDKKPQEGRGRRNQDPGGGNGRGAERRRQRP